MVRKLLIICIFILCTGTFSRVYAEGINDSDDRNKTDNRTTIESIIAEQAKGENVTEILNTIDEYTGEEIYRYFSNISFESIFEDALTGQFKPDMNNLLKGALSFITYELKKNIVIIAYILIITAIYSIIGSLADSSGIKGVKDITGYVCFGAIILIIVGSYMEVIYSVSTMIGDLSGFVISVTPLLITLLSTGGNIVGAVTMSPIIMFCSQFCVVAVDTYFMPVAVSYGLIGMVKSISSEIKLDKLCGFIKSLCVWPLGMILTVFTFILSMQKSIATTGGGLTVKLMKNLIGAVPVVGGKLSEATTTVLSCLGIVRTASGTVIMICIAGIAALPILRTVVLAFVYKAASAVCEIISEKKYSDVIEFASGSLFMIAGISGVISFMFLIIMTIIIGTGNASLAIAT